MSGKDKHPHDTEPAATVAAAAPGLFRLSELKWQEGSGAMKGVQVAVVSEDPTTGMKAMFVRVPATKGKGQPIEYHYHTLTAHTFVVAGSVSTTVNGKQITVGPGDYFRAPAHWVHSDSHGPDPIIHGGDPAILFMIIEGQRLDASHGQGIGAFETVGVER